MPSKLLYHARQFKKPYCWRVSLPEFEKLAAEALNALPEKTRRRLNNVALFAAEEPTSEQLAKMKLKKGDLLFGLFEGHAQGRKLDFGPVLPDRITIFRLAILNESADLAEVKRKIISTLKHEIAHHLGSDERGAARAGRRGI